MSLWTPSGEHSVGDGGHTPGADGPPPEAGGPPPEAGAADDPGAAEAAAVDELRRQLAEAPAEVVVANHCYGLFELAAVYLSQTPPHFEQAQLAIDALGAVVEGLGERLGEAHAPLCDALAQVRLAYVQLGAASAAHRPAADGQG